MPTPWPQPRPVTTSFVAADAGAAVASTQMTAQTHRTQTRQGNRASAGLLPFDGRV
jgi:hypothetical protein